MKRIALVGSVVLVVMLVGGFLWARSVFSGDLVRNTIADQVSKGLGQPVTIGRISASLTPRLTVTLGEVAIGEPARIRAAELQLGTALGALLSRRIEHASVRLTGARIELPLPEFTIGQAGEPASKPPVELVSIDEIALDDVEIVSGGKTVRANVELVPQGTSIDVRRITINADGLTAEISGTITDIAGPKGSFQVKTGALDVDQLTAFANAFTTGAAPSAPQAPRPESTSTAPTAPSSMDITLKLDASKATLGALSLEQLSGTARAAGEGLTLDPVSFGVFDGRYEGSLTLVPDGNAVRFRSASTLTNIDVAAATAFGGSPGVITGRLAGKLELTGRGVDPSSVLSSARGTARVDITDGIVKNLGLVRSIVVATSMREGSTQAPGNDSKDEPFTKLGATLAMANGAVTTKDLSFESKNLVLAAEGVVQLIASTLDLQGRVQLSDELSQTAGRDLVRYTQEGGRVTVPATITGPIDAPNVRIDVSDMAKRALRNAATEQTDKAKAQATEAVKKKLGGLFGR